MAEARAYVQSLDGQQHLPDWAWTLFDYLEEHEAECTPFYSEAKVGPLNYIQWQQAQDLPPNFVAIGDAIMKLNPVYGETFSRREAGIFCLTAPRRHCPT